MLRKLTRLLLPMLQKLFEKDTVLYQLFPVRNYSDVTNVRGSMQEQVDTVGPRHRGEVELSVTVALLQFKTVVLINVGASYDVQAMLNPEVSWITAITCCAPVSS